MSCAAPSPARPWATLVLDWPTSRRTQSPETFWGCRHGDAKATPIGVCVAVAADAKHATDTRGAALVAAANACFACKEATAACEAAGGVAETFKLLKSKCDHEVKARAAGLLARLTTAPGSRGAATLRSAPGAPRRWRRPRRRLPRGRTSGLRSSATTSCARWPACCRARTRRRRR